MIGECYTIRNKFQLYTKSSETHCSEVPIIRPPMVLVESGLNSEQVSLMRHIYVYICKLDFWY